MFEKFTTPRGLTVKILDVTVYPKERASKSIEMSMHFCVEEIGHLRQEVGFSFPTGFSGSLLELFKPVVERLSFEVDELAEKRGVLPLQT